MCNRKYCAQLPKSQITVNGTDSVQVNRDFAWFETEKEKEISIILLYFYGRLVGIGTRNGQEGFSWRFFTWRL